MPARDPRRIASYPCALLAMTLLATGCLDRPVAPATPRVTGRFQEVTNQNAVSKIDLLFMIDNSGSMADKQEIMAAAVPDLVNRLVDPICVNPDGTDSTQRPDPSGSCPAPTERDFDPIKDIHVGIITSSLGGHGAPEVCDGSKDNADLHNADMSHLITRNGTVTLPTFQNLGFLNWNPNLSGAHSDAAKLTADFRTMVTGVGQHGCGYEAQLEAVYRFLVDPAPYRTINLSESAAIPHDVDEVVLKQRADFLRPDSLVAVIAVTDENDYSIIDGGINWVAIARVSDRPQFKGGTGACQTNPNDPCCVNCKEADLPGCMAHDQDPACASPLTDQTDPLNLRASRSKQQYGIDFAWPVERYVEGLTRPTLDRFGAGAKNPLFSDLTCQNGVHCLAERDPTLIFFAGIVGVPWQDIARDPNDLSQGFQSAKELSARGTWAAILGNPTASPPVPPQDPHMIVSVEPRPGIPGPSSAVGADPKNGHEWIIPASGNDADLQYACTFPLVQPRDCPVNATDCDCGNGDVNKNPLCQDASGAYGKRQFGAKAYPGLRELQLLQGLGEQGIVGSICPKNTSDASKADFGYRPAIASLIARLRGPLRGRCLPRALVSADDGSVSCVILEVFEPTTGARCRCEGDAAHPGRATPTRDVLEANPNLSQYGSCTCEIEQLTGGERASCLRDVSPRSDINGWCYVDPGQTMETAQCGLVKNCPTTRKRIIRYLGQQPRGANVIICQEQSFPSNGAGPDRNICGD